VNYLDEGEPLVLLEKAMPLAEANSVKPVTVARDPIQPLWFSRGADSATGQALVRKVRGFLPFRAVRRFQIDLQFVRTLGELVE
jgi:hypothetical protein